MTTQTEKLKLLDEKKTLKIQEGVCIHKNIVFLSLHPFMYLSIHSFKVYKVKSQKLFHSI